MPDLPKKNLETIDDEQIVLQMATRNDEDTANLFNKKREYLVATIADAELKEQQEIEQESPRLIDEVQLPIDEHGDQRFIIRDSLGRGSGGSVFAVYDKLIDREVALKIVHLDVDDAEKNVHRFVREARVTASLEHPHILPIYELNIDADDRTFFTMRKAPGVSLDNLIYDAEEGRVAKTIAAFEDRVEIMLRVCDAISYAHAQGVIHQDIKPGNIMLGDFGEVLVVDWGAALMKDDNRKHRRLMGTPAYMSPEQARCEGSDERSDIYCLGATFYHLLTFTMPTTAKSTEEFWQRKRGGILDALPMEIESGIPRYLLDVARMAMCTEPGDRYQEVSQLRDALLEWRRHRESLAICDEADMKLLRADQIDDYREFEELRGRYQAAVQIWDQNIQAKESLHDLEIAYARCAIRRGDLDLALSLMPEDAPDEMKQEVQKLIKQRQEAEVRGKRLRQTVAIFVVTVLAFGTWLVNDYLNQFGDWQEVYNVDFTNPDARYDDILWTQGDFLRAITPPHCDDAGLHIQKLGMMWFHKMQLRGNVRLTVDVEWHEDIDAVEMFLQAKREQPQLSWHAPSGYSCQAGGHRNLISYVSINYEAGLPTMSTSAATDFQTNRVYSFMFERHGDVLSLYVDGEVLLQEHFILPAASPAHSQVGLRMWADCLIKSVKLERLSLPKKSSPLIAADALLAAGNKTEAYASYAALVEDYPETDIAERAMARACMLAFELGNYADALKMSDLLQEQFPSSSYIARCIEKEALYRWNNSDRDEAISLAEAVLKLDAGSKIVIELLNNRPQVLPSDQRDALLSLLRYSESLPRLDLKNLNLPNIEFLRGIKISALDISENDIVDISPIAGMELKDLRGGFNDIADLKPLAGNPCRRVDLGHNDIESLEGLEGLPLHILDLNNNRVSDVTALSNKQIEQLELHGNPIRDLSPLKSSQIANLNMSKTDVLDLGFLKGSKIKVLDIGGTNITDLRPLRGLGLTSFSASGAEISDLSPLEESSLVAIKISNTNVSDIRALRGLPLRQVDLSRSKVTDLSPLSSSPVRILDIRELDVDALPKLLLSELHSLEVRKTKIKDWSPLIHATELRSLLIQDPSLKDADFTTLFEVWQEKGVNQNVIKQLKKAVAFEKRDWSQLKKMGFRLGNRIYTPLPFRCDYNESVKWAKEAGGSLMRFDQDVDLHNFLKNSLESYIFINNSYFLDAYKKNDIWYWGTGQQIDPDSLQLRSADIVETQPYLIWHEVVVSGLTRTAADSIMHLMIMWED